MKYEYFEITVPAEQSARATIDIPSGALIMGVSYLNRELWDANDKRYRQWQLTLKLFGSSTAPGISRVLVAVPSGNGSVTLSNSEQLAHVGHSEPENRDGFNFAHQGYDVFEITKTSK